MNLLKYEINTNNNELQLEVVFNGTTHTYSFASKEAMEKFYRDKADFIIRSLGYETINR